jgi:hypothetical protein
MFSNESHSRFDDPPVGGPDVRLSGHLDDFQLGAPVRLRIAVTQVTTGAISKVDKIVIAPTFTVTADELSTGQVQDSKFDESTVVATAQAIVYWGKELTLPQG